VPVLEDVAVLSDLLPGAWRIRASNLPEWLNNGRKSPTLVYELVTPDPLVLTDEATWVSDEGEAAQVTGVDRWAGRHFVRRGTGWRRFTAGRWRIAGVDNEREIVVVRYGKSTDGHDGIDILVRDGAQVPNLRKTIADAHDEFGLGLEDFATLSWL
jgi:hypothetical protein